MDRKGAPWKARLGRLFAFLALLLVVTVALKIARVGLNLTESLPIGIYHASAVSRPLLAGDLVEACLPEAAERFALAHRFVPGGGPCPLGSIHFLKMVLAVSGDVVDLRMDAIVVNGHAIPDTKTFATDRFGVVLPHVARGRIRIGPGQLWLWTPNPRSWDSRYYGIVPERNVASVDRLVLPLAPWPYYDEMPLARAAARNGARRNVGSRGG